MPWLAEHPRTCHVTEHHPHRRECADIGCNCAADMSDGKPVSKLDCHVCGEDWPCATKREHLAERGKVVAPPKPWWES